MMYKTKCANCGKVMFTFAKDRLGNISAVFCSRACEGEVRYKNKIINK